MRGSISRGDDVATNWPQGLSPVCGLCDRFLIVGVRWCLRTVSSIQYLGERS